MMEDQVPSSNIPRQAGDYYQNPEGPRYQNPAEFAAAQQQQAAPDFQEMRRIALEQAIQQVTQQQAPTVTPPSQPQYNPQPAPTAQVTEQVRVVRRNLTLAELILIFTIATGSVLGIQGLWSFATDILPRIEIRAK